MPNDCIIENWLRKNKFWLSFVYKIFCIWILLIILLMIVKYFYLGLSLIEYDKARISLNNMLTLGAALSAIAFAWKQIEINQHTANIEVAIRYKDHYVKLIKALRRLIKETNSDSLAELIDITLEAELLFDHDTQIINKEIMEHAKIMIQNKVNKDRSSKIIEEKRQNRAPATDYILFVEENNQAHKKYSESFDFLNSDSLLDKLNNAYKKNTVILTNR